jgi:hypothetical protein
VAISVALPEKLSAEAEEALREFAAKAGLGH